MSLVAATAALLGFRVYLAVVTAAVRCSCLETLVCCTSTLVMQSHRLRLETLVCCMVTVELHPRRLRLETLMCGKLTAVMQSPAEFLWASRRFEEQETLIVEEHSSDK